MGQIRHGCATTTQAIRAAIQRSQATNAALSRELGINVKTVAKWRKRETVEDRQTGPTEPSSTVLSVDEEAMVVAFRRHTLLPLKASFRRIATRYEKTSQNFMAMIKLAAVRLWCEFCEPAA